MNTWKETKVIGLALELLTLFACGNNQQTTNKRETERDDRYYEKWFVYDQPINGYEVTIHWLCDKRQGYWGTGLFSFTKDGTTKVLSHLMDLDGWFDEKELMESPDTIILDQYYDEALQPYLDWRAIVGFADYNFDGNKELVICETPRPYRAMEGDGWLDCETFTFYLDAPKGFLKINNEPFYRLSTETCRTRCTFDPNSQTLTLLTSSGACCSDSTIYYFRKGNPYKSEVVRNEKP